MKSKAPPPRYNPEGLCPELQAALNVLGDRWSMVIMWSIKDSPRRFSEIQKMTGINTRTLTQKLEKLEQNYLVSRQEYKEYPPRTEYAITPVGHALKPVLDSMMEWAKEHL